MRPEIAEADRRFAVRCAAASWQRAGAVGGEARQEIERLYADDRLRTLPWFRHLFFVLTIVGTLGAFGSVGLEMADVVTTLGGWSAILLLVAAGLGVTTETLLRRVRLRRFGVEEATGWLALAAAGGSLALATDPLVFGGLLGGPRLATVVIALPLAVLAALAAFRWGLPLAGAGAAAALFVALAPLPAGRWLWIAAAPPLAWALERAAESPAVAPAQRARAREGWWVALVALYVAVHVESVRSGWLALPAGSGRPAGGAALALAWTAMAALTVFLLASGIVTRRRPRLDAGLLAAAATLAVVVDAADLRPLWAALLVGGLVVVAAALVLGRLFRRAPDRTLGGWTSEPLFDDADRAAALELTGTAAALSPPVRELPREPDFEGEGGEFGGGGASAGF